MQFDHAEISRVEVLLSPERLGPLLSISGDLPGAIILHQHVVQVAAELLGVLSIIEVACRNEICSQLDQKFGQDQWLASGPQEFNWHNQEKQKIGKARFSAQKAVYMKYSNQQKQNCDLVAFPNGAPANISAEHRKRKRIKTILVSSGQQKTQFTLYFWKRLFSDAYERSLWKPCLKNCFPNKNVTRADVATKLEVLYQARNRIAHVEAIYGSRLAAVLDAIDFLAQNLGERRPNPNSALFKLLEPHHKMLTAAADQLDQKLKSYQVVGV